MIRVLNIVLLVACGVGLIGVYALKYQSEGVASRRLELQTQIADQQDQLSVMRAEWAYVTQPGHIAPIVRRHAESLDLAQIRADQFISVDALPMRPAAMDPDALTALLESLDAGIDPIAALIEAN
ncbi:MAG: hypothetical protein KKH72_03720 [Alphaproteobacteria bacterium]|nr:hypothetical protein [Alphaproteobacteria bacterium]